MKTEFGIKTFIAWLDNEALYCEKRKLLTLLLNNPTTYDIEEWLYANDFNWKQEISEVKSAMSILIVSHFCD